MSYNKKEKIKSLKESIKLIRADIKKFPNDPKVDYQRKYLNQRVAQLYELEKKLESKK